MSQRVDYARTAAGWLGIREGSREHAEILEIYNSIRPLPRGYAVQKSDPWCAAFVSAAAVKAGLGALFPLECSCAQIVKKAKTMGIWVEDDAHAPGIGDWVLYNWDASGSGDDTGTPDHVGVITEIKDGTLTVVEGNYSNSVKLRKIPLDWEQIRGFVCPEFDEEENSFHSLDQIPAYARATIEKLVANGSLRGIAEDDLGLSGDLVRTLVILDRLGKL